MIGSVVEREVPDITATTTVPTTLASTLSPNLTIPTTTPVLTNLVVKVVSNSSNPNVEDQIAIKRMEVAVTLAMLVGIIQVLVIVPYALKIRK